LGRAAPEAHADGNVRVRGADNTLRLSAFHFLILFAVARVSEAKAVSEDGAVTDQTTRAQKSRRGNGIVCSPLPAVRGEVVRAKRGG
jgi:hypothetical protein